MEEKEGSTVGSGLSTERETMSRDEVRAQREAKRLAKAARKGKTSAVVGPLTPTTVEIIKEAKSSSGGKEVSMKSGAKTAVVVVAPTLEAQSSKKCSEPKPSGTPPTAPSDMLKPKDKSTVLPKPKKSSGVPAQVDVDILQNTTDYSPVQSLFKSTLKESKAPVKGKPPHHHHLHPLFYSVAVKISNNVIRGANARCIKLLDAIKAYIRIYDVHHHHGMSLKHGLSSDLKRNMDVLKTMCPFAISMTNAVEFILIYLHNSSNMNINLTSSQSRTHQEEDPNRSVCVGIFDIKTKILDTIDQYMEEKIEKAVEAIVLYGHDKIKSGDKIIVYSITEALAALLVKAAEIGTCFELIIIQTPESMLEIAELLNKLAKPISTKTVGISAVNFSNALYRLIHCTKVLIGGHGLFTNGGVMAQSGSGQLALLAATYNKPALFLCETYKFCDRSPLDLFTLDEYMPESRHCEEDGVLVFEPKIMYDVTPSTLVTVVITDIDMLPSNSVPVVLHVQEERSPRGNMRHSKI